MNESASELAQFPEGTEIVPIHPLAKYVISVPSDRLPEDPVELADELQRYADIIDMWWNDGNPFIILTSEFTLVNIAEVDLVPEEEDDEEKA